MFIREFLIKEWLKGFSKQKQVVSEEDLELQKGKRILG
jgi:hypothetical protein